LQLANFKVGNRDGHDNNIIVKLDDNGKAIGLVPIDFDNQVANGGQVNFRKLEECLAFVKPGMVEKITKEFEDQCPQTQKLYDLAELLGVKRDEYQHLPNKDLTAKDFQTYLEKVSMKSKHIWRKF